MDSDQSSETSNYSVLSLPEDGRILFFERDRDKFGFLSNFHPAAIQVDNETWPTSEHYYQAQKSHHREYRAAIRNAETPGQAKRLGALPGAPNRQWKHSWFRQHAVAPRSDWMEVRLQVMRVALAAKFGQNPLLRKQLSDTGNHEIVEDSATDDFWGIGRTGLGQNWLGRLLMEARNEVH